ncbi:MAG TPA: XRE family transcriptional regulator [Thermoleophilaceae bacterium]|nr:XRE family transcriptional regulator [Thermoleophilaceae bacterium]
MTEANDQPLHQVTRRIGRTLRAHRTERGMSLGDLARAAGLSKSILARIEADGGNPSVETLWRLSLALGVPLGSLLGGEEGPRVRRLPARASEPMPGDSGMTGWLLHTEGRVRRTEVFDLDFPAGTDHEGSPHLPGTEELVLCVSGRMRVGPEGEQQELGPGDAVVFAADVPHRYTAIEASQALDWILYLDTSA